jgi:hypothetical protein
MNLMTESRGLSGSFSRPDNGSIARGLILTLSKPGSLHFTPATAQVVLQRIGEAIPQMGFEHQDAPDYATYLS